MINVPPERVQLEVQGVGGRRPWRQNVTSSGARPHGRWRQVLTVVRVAPLRRLGERGDGPAPLERHCRAGSSWSFAPLQRLGGRTATAPAPRGRCAGRRRRPAVCGGGGGRAVSDVVQGQSRAAPSPGEGARRRLPLCPACGAAAVAGIPVAAACSSDGAASLRPSWRGTGARYIGRSGARHAPATGRGAVTILGREALGAGGRWHPSLLGGGGRPAGDPQAAAVPSPREPFGDPAFVEGLRPGARAAGPGDVTRRSRAPAPSPCDAPLPAADINHRRCPTEWQCSAPRGRHSGHHRGSAHGGMHRRRPRYGRRSAGTVARHAPPAWVRTCCEGGLRSARASCRPSPGSHLP